MNMQQRLAARQQSCHYRSLKQFVAAIDFLSNDYLGFARSVSLRQTISRDVLSLTSVGSTGSRLLSGNKPYLRQLEEELASFFKAESGLLFTSGFTLNSGLLSAITEPQDVVILDQYAHASWKQALKLSSAQGFFFRHNDAAHLFTRLKRLREVKQHRSDIFVVVDSVYSMEGDVAPLKEFVEICEKFSAYLIVDEAHAMGTIGGDGKGLTVGLGLEKRIFARIATFGKAFGTSGALLLGSRGLMDYIVNFCQSFIYTTGMSLVNAVSIKVALQELNRGCSEIGMLHQHIRFFNERLGWSHHQAPIYSFICSSIGRLKKMTTELQRLSCWVQPIFSPTVPKGKERLRVCLHSYNTKDEIEMLYSHLKRFCL